ncbi:MAG TPA: SAF domain-containing protein [Acidimicrobiales bacterium]|jgi:hypothetical protein|nr:SAF domain-containing protein [Acidimicrobiales bacterium]
MFGDETRTGTATVPPPRTRLGRRQQAPVPSSPQGLPVRRRWGRFAAGAVLALLGAWIFASLYVSAGERVEVVAVARDVAQYEEIESSDLKVVRVAAGPEVDTIDADDRDDLVGRRAATPLKEGTLLASSQVIDEDLDVLEPDEAMTTVDVDPGPASVLAPGMDVSVVVSPEQGTTGETAHDYPGWILAVGEADQQTRARPVTVVVSRTAATVVADAGKDDRVTFVGLEGIEGN